MADLVDNATDIPSLHIGEGDDAGVYFFSASGLPHQVVPNAPIWSHFYQDSGEHYVLHALPASILSNWVIQGGTPIYGSFRSTVEQDLIVTTTDDVNTPTLLLAHTDVFPAGNFTISWSYGWNYDRATSDVLIWADLDGVQLGLDHRQEPKDTAGNPNEVGSSGSNQTHWVSRRRLDVPLTAGAHTFRLFIASTAVGIKATAFEMSAELLRTS
jgi:hypothetical protein